MKTTQQITAKEILGNSDYLAMSYGGYRTSTRDIQPTLAELKEDLRIMFNMGVRIIRTYNVQLAHAKNVLQAIQELKQEDSNFEMYVMLGAWIDCQNAWTDLAPNHDIESEHNAAEIDRAVSLAQKFPEIIKIIAVGNEAMVKWATSYYVQPRVILKWVNHLQLLKEEGELSHDLWITSSDNFASWGGGDSIYHVPELNELIRAVDYLSIHTYPMHDTHYNPTFWGITENHSYHSKKSQIEYIMQSALEYAISQFDSVKSYMHGIGENKPIHIGETGWASHSNKLYGSAGSKATDEYKSGLYYQLIRDWTNQAGISCFYFEAFDEPWKDAQNPGGSENHFGLISLDGQAKYALWPMVDEGKFEGLYRGKHLIRKSFDGSLEDLMEQVEIPQPKPQSYMQN